MHMQRLRAEGAEPVEGDLPSSRRIDPETREVERARVPDVTRPRPLPPRVARREPSKSPVEHLAFDWFPLRVTPGKERLARLLLEDRGLVTFCPMEVKFRHRNHVQKARGQAKPPVAYPWHPGLVCVGLCWPYRWHLVVSVAPFQSIVSSNPDRPRRMRHDAIWRLMARFGEGRFVRPDHQRWMQTGSEFDAGDVVRVTTGPLEGQAFRVDAISGSTARLFGRWFGTSDYGFDVPVEILAKDG